MPDTTDELSATEIAPLRGPSAASRVVEVETARRLGVTLVGQLRGARFTIYANAHRIDLG